jgi:hypothetical protein
MGVVLSHLRPQVQMERESRSSSSSSSSSSASRSDPLECFNAAGVMDAVLVPPTGAPRDDVPGNVAALGGRVAPPMPPRPTGGGGDGDGVEKCSSHEASSVVPSWTTRLHPNCLSRRRGRWPLPPSWKCCCCREFAAPEDNAAAVRPTTIDCKSRRRSPDPDPPSAGACVAREACGFFAYGLIARFVTPGGRRIAGRWCRGCTCGGSVRAFLLGGNEGSASLQKEMKRGTM